MNTAEVSRLLTQIKGAWTRFDVTKETFESYAAGLGDLAYDGASQAVAELTRSEEWPPSIAKIRKVYYENAGVPNEHRAWAAVLKVAKRGRQAVEPLYQTMDAMTVEALREAGGLIRLWNLDTDAEIEGMKRTFVETYRALYTEEIRKPVLLAGKLNIAIGQGSGHGHKLGPGGQE